MFLELIKVGGGACNTSVGLEFGSILTNPLALHFSLNFHVVIANKIIFWRILFRALREHNLAIWVSLDFGTSFRCAHVMLNFFHYFKCLLIVGCGFSSLIGLDDLATIYASCFALQTCGCIYLDLENVGMIRARSSDSKSSHTCIFSRFIAHLLLQVFYCFGVEICASGSLVKPSCGVGDNILFIHSL